VSMGLDTTHDAWHGAYSAFMRWREKVGPVWVKVKMARSPAARRQARMGR
jgi:hypothetical protein